MRDLKNFSAGEWLRFVPLEVAFKQARNDGWLAIYKKIRPKALDSFLVETERFGNRPVALVIAFEQPWALDWLLRMAQRNLADTAVLVFDNSRRAAARLDIERVCRNRGVPYLALPVNRTQHVNRSHGMAMTWVFHNVVRVHPTPPVRFHRPRPDSGPEDRAFGTAGGSTVLWQAAGKCVGMATLGRLLPVRFFDRGGTADEFSLRFLAEAGYGRPQLGLPLSELRPGAAPVRRQPLR